MKGHAGWSATRSPHHSILKDKFGKTRLVQLGLVTTYCSDMKINIVL